MPARRGAPGSRTLDIAIVGRSPAGRGAFAERCLGPRGDRNGGRSWVGRRGRRLSWGTLSERGRWRPGSRETAPLRGCGRAAWLRPGCCSAVQWRRDASTQLSRSLRGSSRSISRDGQRGFEPRWQITAEGQRPFAKFRSSHDRFAGGRFDPEILTRTCALADCRPSVSRLAKCSRETRRARRATGRLCSFEPR